MVKQIMLTMPFTNFIFCQVNSWKWMNKKRLL
nr:MAG TPA: hypothetical protein [Caudoviricetes sp.]DAQ86817.1 MAG TPA: hypothetical protein [Caudoviricetes sp.]